MAGRVTTRIATFFDIPGRNSTIRTEILAGLTTYLSLLYIIVVNPLILIAAGIPAGMAVYATVLSACFGTLLMAFYANRPYAVAPYMGQNALVTFILAGTLHYPWQAIMGANLIAGALFTVFILSGAWRCLIVAIPDTISRSCTRGIGFFIAFLGYYQSEIIVVGSGVALSHYVRNIEEVHLAILIAGFVVIGIFMIRKIPGALIAGILVSAVLAFATRIEELPTTLFSLPPAPWDIAPQIDIAGALAPAMIPVVLLFFLLTLFDSIATIMGLFRLGEPEGYQPDPTEIRKPFLVNSVSMMFSPLAGSTTAGMFIESAAGINEGGRTGLTALVVAVLFGLSLFFIPAIDAFPAIATSSALMVIGLLMMAPLRLKSLAEKEELLTSFVLMVVMTLTQNIGIGLSTGVLVYPVFMAAAGKRADIHPAFWGLAACALVFLMIFPY
jgi:AGZA family xanthine/uracil permease-like MFS transporter